MLTIVTPNLNNAKYLEENILAIKKLTIPYEHIIVDGGSTDESLGIIARYPHIILLNQAEKTGMYGAIHQGFMAAKGDYLTWVNADDRIISSGVEAMYKEIIRGGCDFIYSDGYYFFESDGHKEYSRGRRFPKFFLKHGCMPTMQPSSIYTKKIYLECGGLLYKKFRIIGDLDLFRRMAMVKNSVFKYLAAPSTTFINRGDSLGNSNSDIYYKELKENHIPIPNIFIKILFSLTKHI